MSTPLFHVSTSSNRIFYSELKVSTPQESSVDTQSFLGHKISSVDTFEQNDHIKNLEGKVSTPLEESVDTFKIESS